MSILDRLNLLIRSEISDISRGGSFKSAMSEMEGSIKAAKRQKAELRRSENNLVAQIREVREKANRWEDRAVLALKNGDETLAREALIMKNRALDDANRMRDELDDYRAQIRDIEKALEALDMKLSGARGRLENDRGGSRTGRAHDYQDEAAWDAEMRRRMHREGQGGGGRSEDYLEPLDGMVEQFGSGRAFEEFDRMSSKINAMEADIEAMRELSDDDPLIDPRKKELEGIFDRMERKKKSDDDLADLKKKFE